MLTAGVVAIFAWLSWHGQVEQHAQRLPRIEAEGESPPPRALVASRSDVLPLTAEAPVLQPGAGDSSVPAAVPELSGRLCFYDPVARAVLEEGRWLLTHVDTGARLDVRLEESVDGRVPLSAGRWRVAPASDSVVAVPGEFNVLADEERVLLVGQAEQHSILVQDAEGVPVAGAAVAVAADDSERWTAFRATRELILSESCSVTIADSAGRAMVRSLSPGRQWVSVSHPSVGTQAQLLTSHGAEPCVVTLHPQAGARELRVIDGVDGEPIAGAALNDATGLVSSLSGPDGTLRYWPEAARVGHVVLSADGYVPVLVRRPTALEPDHVITLLPTARLTWELTADLPSTDRIVSLTLPRPGDDDDPVLLPRWTTVGQRSGVFTVPRGVEVVLESTDGLGTLREERVVSAAEEHVRFHDDPIGGNAFLEFAGDLRADSVAVEMEFADTAQALRVPVRNGRSVVPRPSLVRNLRIRHGDGEYQIRNDDGSERLGEGDTIHIGLPPTVRRTVVLLDTRDRPVPGLSLRFGPSAGPLGEATSSDPRWTFRYFEPVISRRSDSTGRIGLALPTGSYPFVVVDERSRHESASRAPYERRRDLPAGTLRFDSSTKDAVIIRCPSVGRVIQVAVAWDDGRPVDSFEIESRGPTRRGSGGHWSGEVEPDEVDITVRAEGALPARIPIDGLVDTYSCTLLATQQQPSRLVAVQGVADTADRVRLSVYSRSDSGALLFEKSVNCPKKAPGLFEMPDSRSLDGKFGKFLAVGPGGERAESEMVAVESLGNRQIHLSVIDH